jgi:hypothetical protein
MALKMAAKRSLKRHKNWLREKTSKKQMKVQPKKILSLMLPKYWLRKSSKLYGKKQ